MQKIESGGRILVRLETDEAPFVEGTQRIACHRKGCCRFERLYLNDGGYEEVQTECHSAGLLGQKRILARNDRTVWVIQCCVVKV